MDTLRLRELILMVDFIKEHERVLNNKGFIYPLLMLILYSSLIKSFF